MYKFMQIYGNCTAVHILGKDRIKGPVDNVITKGIDFLEVFLHGDYLSYIKNHTPIVSERIPANPKDHPFLYEYPIVSILHNDPRTEKSYKNLQKRLDNFKDFKQKVLTDKNYYFIYSLNDWDVDKTTHKVFINKFIQNLDFLKKEKLLDKIIFVETRNYERPNSFWNFWATNVKEIIKKYNLKYVQVTGLIGGGEVDNSIKAVPEFYKKATEVITPKPTVTKQKETNNYYLYF